MTRWIKAAVLVILASGPRADHGTQGVALPVEVRKGQQGVGGWSLMILPEEELYVGTYRVGDYTVDQVSYAVPAGSYAQIRDMALGEIAGVAAFEGGPCEGYLRDTVMVVTSSDTADVLDATCAHGPTIAARDRIAEAMRGLVAQ